MKLTLNDVTNIGSIATINDNFDKIEKELQDKVLYRDNPTGEPNSMQQDLDMNGKDILNVRSITTAEGRWATVDEVDAIQANVESMRDEVEADKDLVEILASQVQSNYNATETLYDDFGDRYLGVKASDPSVDNDGNALLSGALYFRSSAPPLMRVFNGTAWQDVGSITSTNTNTIDSALFASQAEAEAGANNTKVMTPLRTKQSIDQFAVRRSGDTMTGALKLSGNAVDPLDAVPKQQLDTKAALSGSASQQFSVAAGTSSSHAVNRGQFGWEKDGPSWKITRPDGIIEIGGEFFVTIDGVQNFSFAFGGFPNECFDIQMQRYGANITSVMGPSELTRTGFSVDRDNDLSASQYVRYRAIGY